MGTRRGILVSEVINLIGKMVTHPVWRTSCEMSVGFRADRVAGLQADLDLLWYHGPAPGCAQGQFADGKARADARVGGSSLGAGLLGLCHLQGMCP